MQRVKFILSSLAILLAGALAAGFAARAVVAPRAGEPVSAGVLSVPSVLGQTAEEVLFYPWSTYDAQAMLPLPEAIQADVEQTQGPQDNAGAHTEALLAFYAEALSPFRLLFGAQYDNLAIAQAMEVGQSEQLGYPIFLKDFAAAGPEDEALLLSFARATGASVGQSISFLVKPARSETPTQTQQNAALAQVQADLDALLQLDAGMEENPLYLLLSQYYDFSKTFGLNFEPLECLGQALEVSMACLVFTADADADDDLMEFVPAEEPAGPPLDDAFDRLEQISGYTVQLVSTPQQIVLLFAGPDRSVVGVYYDIQLERYSGVGLSGP